MSRSLLRLSVAAVALSTAAIGGTQDRLEQANPRRVEQSRPDEPELADPAPPPTALEPVEPVETAASAQPILLSAIDLTGLVELTPADLRPTLTPFLNRPIALDELKDVVNAIVTELRRRGYIFASARIPPQSVDSGRLTIAVDEGRIDGVTIDGYDQAFVRRILDRLANGQPVTRARLERQLLLANDGTGIYVGRSSYEMSAGQALLNVKVERDPVVAQVTVDNWGSQFVGPVRARAAVRFGGVFDGMDALAVSLSTVPLSPREYGYGRVGYTRRLNTNGLEASVSASVGETRPGASLRARETAGSSRSVSSGVSQAILRRRSGSLWADLGLTVRSSSQDQFGLTVRDDRFTNLTADLYGSAAVGDARVRGRVTVTKGVGLFDATRQGDPLASRSDGDARFTTLFAASSVTVPVMPRVEVQLAGEGQLASRPLLSSEEFGVGGANIGRGYDYSERLGDEGVAGLAQVRYALPDPFGWVDELSLSTFVDGGVTRDKGVRRFDGSIASAGFGVGLDLDEGFAGELSVGFPLTGPRDASGDGSPRLGFTFGKRF